MFLDKTKMAGDETPERHLHGLYKTMLEKHDLWDGKPGEKSYNLLVTIRWMMMVPRSTDKYGSISLFPFFFMLIFHFRRYCSEFYWIFGINISEDARGSQDIKRDWSYDYS